jgi:hypothetical protein
VSDYVNRDDGGWTELRVHGVSGTPPDAVLGHPHVVQVSGDAQAGFYRRRWEAASVAADTDQHRLEAYSWGGLTAGGGQRALWLLLTPFLLVNVAFWARPDQGRDPRGFVRPVRRFGEAVQRLFALSITLVLVLAVVAASMDLIGWQCVRPGAGSCADRVSWLGFLSWDWLASPGRRLALTAVFPLAVVGLLWWLANKTWRETEAVRMPPADSEDTQETPLESRRLWNGTGPVRRLRAVHVTAAFALVGVFLLTPFARDWSALRGRSAGGWATATELLLLALLILLAGSVMLTCLPSMTDRLEANEVEEHTQKIDLYRYLPMAALAFDALTLVVLWLPGLEPPDPTPGAPRANLPWLAAAVDLVSAAQAVLLLAAAAVVAVMLLGRRRTPKTAEDPRAAGHPVDAPAAWFGFATVVFMMLGSALAGGYAAALVLTVAHAAGKPQPVDRGLDPFVVPMPYFWAAALSVPIAVMGLVLAVVLALVLRYRARGNIIEQVQHAYPGIMIKEALAAPRDPANAVIARRARNISDIWARAVVGDAGRIISGVFVAFLGALLIVAGIGYVRDPDWISAQWQWMVNVGDVLVGLFALGMLYVGRQTYRNPQFRRSVGVLWDLGTFWPRATHPLAPPCYAERAVPDLINRIHHLGRDEQGRILLSCHSQGTVIGLAVVMQLTYAESSRVALLTYGSPLRRLYARFFPAFFNLPALLRAGAFLHGRPIVVTDEARRRWPWRNLYRPSDPIGGPIIADYPSTETSDEDWLRDPETGDNNDVDRYLVDPRFAKPLGDGFYPPAFGHSGYPDDRAYTAAAAKLQQLRIATPAEQDRPTATSTAS